MQPNGDSENFAMGRGDVPWQARTVELLPRLYLGIIFLVAVYPKITAPPGFAKILTGYLNGVALVQGFSWYQPMVRAVILPHAAVFAVLVMLAEVFVGLAMLAGFATRAAAVVAISLLLNYLCSKGMPLWAPASNDAADIVLAVAVGLSQAKSGFPLGAFLKRLRRS